MTIGIPGVIGVAVEVISVCLEMEIDSGVFSDWRVKDFDGGLALTSQMPR